MVVNPINYSNVLVLVLLGERSISIATHKNHFASVCRQPKKSESVNVLIPEISHQNLHPQSISAINNTNITEIPAQLSFPLHDTPNSFTSKLVLIFPEGGASICIAGTQHLPEFNIDEQNLLQYNKTITAI